MARATALARGRGAGTIALIIGDVADPFYARLARGVEEIAAGLSHVVLVASSAENPRRESEIVDALADRQVSGIVAVPTTDGEDWLEAMNSRGYSVVFVDRPGAPDSADRVLTDNASGAAAGVAHLLARGCRRIAFVGNDETVYTSAERLSGFRRAHAAAGRLVDEALVVLGPRTVADAQAAVAALLRGADPPDAVFAQNDLMSIGAWRAANAAETRTWIVGFDDFELADVLDPPVTVVLQDAVELGRRAATLLFERISGDYTGPAREVLVPTRLIVR